MGGCGSKNRGPDATEIDDVVMMTPEASAMLQGESARLREENARLRAQVETRLTAADTPRRAHSTESLHGEEHWSAAGYVASLGLHELLGAALVSARAADADELEHVKSLDEATVRRLLDDSALRHEVGSRVWAGISQLLRPDGGVRGSAAPGMHSKFQDDSLLELSYGSLSTFFGGLEGLIGPPSPRLVEAMQAEHCDAADAHAMFTTRNYVITTCSSAEWMFVTSPCAQRESNSQSACHARAAC